MKKTIVTIAVLLTFYTVFSQQWTSWQNLDDGWEKNLKGRTEIINPYTGKFIQYEVKNDYKFLVFFSITFEWNTGETGRWEWILEPGKTKNWIREATGIKKVDVVISKYKGADGEYHNIGEAVNTSLGSFKLSYEGQLRLRDYYRLLEKVPTIKKVFANSPFAFLFSGGSPRPDEVYSFPWVAFANACKALNYVIPKRIYDDAAQNCSQPYNSADAKFWCELAEIYEKK